MIEFDAGEHRRPGTVVEELGALVEIGGLVFVSFDDEMLSLPQMVAELLSPENTPHEPRRVESRFAQHPGHQGGSRGLAMGPGYDHGMAIAQEELLHRL